MRLGRGRKSETKEEKKKQRRKRDEERIKKKERGRMKELQKNGKERK